jgi:hypothetical protein
MIGDFLALVTPLDPLHGDGYQFWSGIGLGGLGFGSIGMWWRKHNCHVKRCPRLQWHVNDEHGHPVCRTHHPDSDHPDLN